MLLSFLHGLSAEGINCHGSYQCQKGLFTPGADISFAVDAVSHIDPNRQYQGEHI